VGTDGCEQHGHKANVKPSVFYNIENTFFNRWTVPEYSGRYLAQERSTMPPDLRCSGRH